MNNLREKIVGEKSKFTKGTRIVRWTKNLRRLEQNERHDNKLRDDAEHDRLRSQDESGGVDDPELRG